MFRVWPDVASLVYAGEMHSEMDRSWSTSTTGQGVESMQSSPLFRFLAEVEEKKERRLMMVELGRGRDEVNPGRDIGAEKWLKGSS